MTSTASGPAHTRAARVPCAAYLEAADAAGAVHRLDGHLVVAGEHGDPLTGELQCLVEYAAPALLGPPHHAGRLPGLSDAMVPGAASVLLRHPGQGALPAPWTRSLTYLRLHAAAAVPASGLVLREATAADVRSVRSWLAEAIGNGLRARRTSAAASEVAAAADAVWNRADRVTLVVVADGEPVGHGTLLMDEYDDLTGEPFVDLWDTLVARPELRGPATDLLIAAAAERAARASRPLVGNVVHAAPGSDGEGHGERIVASLTAKGWRVTHEYWHHPLDRGDM